MDRRAFLRTAGATAAGVATLGSARAQSTISAVSDLGLDPSGSEPIGSALDDVPAGTIQFSSDGVFRVTDRIVLRPPGPVDLVGNGCTLKLDPGVQARAFNSPKLPPGSRIQGFVIDQTADGALSGIRLGTTGSVEARDITVRGFAEPMPDTPFSAVFTPIARNESATVRLTNCTAVGGTAAGLHDDGSAPASAPENRLGTISGVYVGASNRGTVQLVNAKLRGWQNGIYGARTPGSVEVLGGTYWNNPNSQVRIGGGSIIDGATLVLDDRQWSMQKNPGPYALGENQGVNGVRVETGGEKGVQSKPATIRNTEIRGLSMGEGSALVEVEGSAPRVDVENTRIENHIDMPHVHARPPGSQGSYLAAPLTAVGVSRSVLSGSMTGPAVEIEERPQSGVAKTCLTIPGAGPDDIVGANVKRSVSFGKCKSGFGLSAPEKVGSGAKVSELPAPKASTSSSGTSSATRQRRQTFVAAIVQRMVFVVLFVVALVAVLALLPVWMLWKLLS